MKTISYKNFYVLFFLSYTLLLFFSVFSSPSFFFFFTSFLCLSNHLENLSSAVLHFMSSCLFFSSDFSLRLLPMLATVSTVTDVGDKQDSLATNNQRMTNLHPPRSPFSPPLPRSLRHAHLKYNISKPSSFSLVPLELSLHLSLNASILSPIYCTFFMHERAHVFQVSSPARNELVCTSAWKLNECNGHQNIDGQVQFIKDIHCSSGRIKYTLKGNWSMKSIITYIKVPGGFFHVHTPDSSQSSEDCVSDARLEECVARTPAVPINSERFLGFSDFNCPRVSAEKFKHFKKNTGYPKAKDNVITVKRCCEIQLNHICNHDKLLHATNTTINKINRNKVALLVLYIDIDMYFIVYKVCLP